MNLSDDDIAALAKRLLPEIMKGVRFEKPWLDNILIPDMDVYRVDHKAPFMQYSSCSSQDFFHPEFKRISDLIGLPPVFHRKYWEWVFVVHHAFRTKAMGPGKRGLVFGVGQENLPAVFAKAGAFITATDAPSEIGIGSGWQAGDQFSSGLAALPNGDMDRAEFEKLVEYKECDMNNISDEFTDYDFCWSSCCLEHLGTLRLGLDFIRNSVEKTLKSGGVAVHTTEFNLSSNTDTVESGLTVLYRKRDIDDFVEEMRGLGHTVEPFCIANDNLVIDGYVDTPPFHAPPHLRLRLEGYSCTSAGLIITKR